MKSFEFIDKDTNIFVFNVFNINECITVSIKFRVFVNFPGKTAKIWRKTPELELASVKL